MKNIRRVIILNLLFWILVTRADAQEHWSPDHVYYGRGGYLTYTPDEQGNVIPDFSHVGYRYGDVPVPDVKTVVEVSPVEGDDGASIQSAITSLYTIQPDENGFRGTVLLKAGTYQVSGQIKISVGGIVLRGEGNSENGTIIVAEGKSTRDLIRIDNGKSRSVNSSSRVTVNETYVPVGRKYVIVSSASGFSAGDHIVLYRPGTSQWISDIKMDQITPSEGTVQWSPSGYSFYFERLVTKVSGDTLFFRNPVVMAMESRYGGGAVYKYTFNRIQNVGIENLTLKSSFTSSQDEEHSWNAIAFYSTEHSWVRNVTSWYFANSCVIIQSSARLITVENCHCREPKSVITGGRRYSFNINGSLNLFKNCTASEGRHDFVTGARVTGPNVFTESTATNAYSDTGPHHRWAMGTLFDVIVSDGEINVQDRDDSGTGHGWAGANTFFWNCKGSSSICESPWTSAKNYNFGFSGMKERSSRPDGEWVGHNVPGIVPGSLYKAQLDERLNGTTCFSMLPQLKFINDTTFLVEFSLPPVPDQVIPDNFIVSGHSDLPSEQFSVYMQDEYTAVVSSGKFREWPALSIITIGVKNLTTPDGKPLTGVTSASYKIADTRPVVTGQAKVTDNVEGTTEASSDKSGYIYLVRYGVNATQRAELDSLVNANLGRKTEAPLENVAVLIATRGLPGGYYQYYAVDALNRISLPSSTWILVEEKGPVTGIKHIPGNSNFIVFQKNDKLIIDPRNEKKFNLEIFTIKGQIIFKEKNLTGIQTLDFKGSGSMFIIKKTTGSEVSIVKFLTGSV